MSLRLLLSITNWVRYGGTVVRYDGTVTVVRWYGGTVQWDGTVVRGDSTLVQYCGTVAISGCIIHSLIQSLNKAGI